MNNNGGVKFSKKVVTFCMIISPFFSFTVVAFNWFNKTVQPEIIEWFFRGFIVHLVTVAIVTAVKTFKKGDDEDAGNNQLSGSDGSFSDYPSDNR